ncbi:S9 family peptidase [Evansella cellulosilytica]|uniref:WD40-like beta Propeller containing protein n=1 Tax=Evansella cellulosilytica (strain ATCC 21833 / DSM 2522 / FERM P-1141 / JCM 9156 / N-4) TaxID=649639 RepID=E6TSR3_EVAC2|nr:S9 family peptidase [Evansella cellulosilytica]ADU29571.1 WD40-like beta Propeller containing protein [Evansella cellulosilytica DSM 2522]
MTKRSITAEDLVKFKFVGDPQVSPNKDKAAYVLTHVDKEKDGYYSNIYVTDLKGPGRQFTSHYAKEDKLVVDAAPKWSPDGSSLAFRSNRTGKNQVYLLHTDGGEAIQLTDVKQGVGDYDWSPDGSKLVLTIRGEFKLSTDKDEEKKEEKSDVKVITRLRYKGDGAGIYNDDRTHVYLFDVNTKEYTKVTEGDHDFGQPRFSPDGASLIYIGTKAEDKEWGYLPAIWKYDIEKKEEALFYQGNGYIYAPSFSPDGKWLAFAGHNRGERSQGNANVLLLSYETGELKNLTENFDYTVGNLVGVDAKYDTGGGNLTWDATSSHIYFIATVGGDCQLFRVNLKGEVSDSLSPSVASVTSYDIVNDDKAVLVLATPHSTGDVVTQDLTDVKSVVKLTNWNEALYDEVHLSTPENFHYKSTDGWDIEGWVMKPFGYEEGKKYPMILQIHGGPATAYGNGLHHEMQLMAAKGYVVLYTNPRGSHGYGHDFVNAVIGDYGGMDYEDIMAGVDYALDNFSYIDNDQLFVTGGSYGGYMTNVIVTRTDRFKAAVTQRCISNWHSFYGTSDIGFLFTEWQHGHADLWDDVGKLLELSPLTHARNVKTPTLILHSEQDLRCPMEQAEQWYIALKRLGVETKLVRFPDENHDLSRSGKPKHRLERLAHLIGWFEDRKN